MVPPPAVRQERSTRRREALLQAAMELLSESGVSALTHRSVAARAGLPSSSTGYYFPTIQELVDATVDAYTERGIAEVVAAATTSYGPHMSDDEVLDGITRALVEVPRGLQMSILDLYLQAGRQPELQALTTRVSELLEWVVDRVLDLIGVQEKGNTARTVRSYAIGALVTRLGAPHSHADSDALALRAGLAVVMADALRSRHPAAP